MTEMPARQLNAVPPAAPLRLGVRAHDFGRMPAEALAAAVAAGGFTHVQLVLNKAIAGLNLQAGDLTAELARSIGLAFQNHGIQIAVLGCYINPIHPDPATRGKLLEYFKDHLRFAREFDCPLVALESGSVNADYSPHPDNHRPEALQDLLGSLAELVAAAQEAGVNVGLEAVTSHTVSSAQKMRLVLDTLGSQHLQVVLDPVNLLSPANCRDQHRVMAEAVELLGDRVAVLHAKDFVEDRGAWKTVPAGQGQLDYRPVLAFARRREVCVLLEEADAAAAAASAQFLRHHFLETHS